MKGKMDEVKVNFPFTINGTGIKDAYGLPLDGTKFTPVSKEYVNATDALALVSSVNGHLPQLLAVLAQRVLRNGGEDTDKTQWTSTVALYTSSDDETFALFDDNSKESLLEQILRA